MANRKGTALAALPPATRERIVAEVFGAILEDYLEEPPGDIDAVRTCARRLRVSPVVLVGILLASPQDRRAWARAEAARGGGRP